MITIQSETYTKPSLIQPAYSVNGMTAQSDKTSEPSHRFLFDIYVDGTKVGRLKSLPSYNNYSSVEISDIVRNYVENEFLHQNPRSVPNDEDNSTQRLYGVVRTQFGFLPKIKVLVGEEYKVNGVLTTFNGEDVPGDPIVKVSEYYSSYQAMDTNSPNILIGRGGITNSQFQANHMDVLEYVNRGNLNSFEWDSNIPIQYRTDSLYGSTIWDNQNVKYLSNRPLESEINLETPSSISYYEGHQIYLNNNISDKKPFDNYDSTMGRRNDMDPFDDFPEFTGDYNTYRQRIQTIGYQYYDPSGLEVGEVRYQPYSNIYEQPIKDGFGFDIVEQYGEDGIKVNDFLQTNIQTGAEYSKFEQRSDPNFINLVDEIDRGDFRTITGGDISYFFSGDIDEVVGRQPVVYKEGDKVCSYTPPSYLKKSFSPNDFSLNSSIVSNGNYVQRYDIEGGQSITPYVLNVVRTPGFNDYRVEWDMRSIPDRIEVLVDGIVIFDSGYVSWDGFYDFNTTSDNIQVKIYRDNTSTFWDFQVYNRIASTTFDATYPVNPNKQYKFSVDVPTSSVDVRMRIFDGNTEVYDSGFVDNGAETSGIYFGSSTYRVEISKSPDGDFWIDWDLNTYLKDIAEMSITMEDTAIEDLTPLKVKYSSGLSYAQTSTFSCFVSVDKFNNIGKDKNLLRPKFLNELRTGDHFYIQNEYIIGVDNSLGELYGSRYNFNLAPALRLWNEDEGRWCNQDEVERLTGRSLESQNYKYENRAAIEILEAKPTGQFFAENNGDTFQEISITFMINRASWYPNVIAYPAIFGGVNFEKMAPTFNYKFDRFRLSLGNDKPLRNANNYKVNIYDYDNNFNMIPESLGNGGKFIYNMNGFDSPFGYFNTSGPYTPGDSLQYWTYGVNGNDFGEDGSDRRGLLNSPTEQRVGSGQIVNIETTEFQNYFILLQTQTASRIDYDTLALSYLLRQGQEYIYQNTTIDGLYNSQYGSKLFVEVSCMICVKDSPEEVDLTYIGLGPLVNGPSLTTQQEIYRAQDKGRWKRIHTIQGFNVSDFRDNPQYAFLNNFVLELHTNLITDDNVWNGKNVDIADVRINFMLGDENNAQHKRDNIAHKVYTKSLRKLNEGREPHYTFSGDMLRNEAYSLYWLNPYGAWDDYRFKGRSIKTTNVSRQTRGVGLSQTGQMNSNAVRNKQNFGDNIIYNIEASEVYEFTSDYLTDEQREWMEECFISPKHYIYDEKTKWFVKVELLNKEYTTIKKNNQKLYQIKLEVQVSSERRTQQVLGSI